MWGDCGDAVSFLKKEVGEGWKAKRNLEEKALRTF